MIPWFTYSFPWITFDGFDHHSGSLGPHYVLSKDSGYHWSHIKQRVIRCILERYNQLVVINFIRELFMVQIPFWGMRWHLRNITLECTSLHANYHNGKRIWMIDSERCISMHCQNHCIRCIKGLSVPQRCPCRSCHSIQEFNYSWD